VIDADEIANAPAALKKLDINGDGRLTPDEYRPQRPDASGSRSDPPMAEGSSRLQGDGRRPGPEENRQEVTRGPGGGTHGGSQEGPPRLRDSSQGPPRPPIDLALDENGDEVIDAGEIANAASRLLKLDLDGDGKLSRMECLPQAPSDPSGKR
jgi:hypothetical protein